MYLSLVTVNEVTVATVLPEDVAKHLNYITSQIYGEETNNA